MTTSRRYPSRGFTLVELLVVILIIGILIAMLTTAARYAVLRAQEFTISKDVNQLASAIEAYQQKHGDYPPDFTDYRNGVPWQRTVAYRHIRKAFPRIHSTEMALIQAQALNIDNAEVLVFWLGGLSDDAKYPFSGTGGPLSGGERNKGFAEFKDAQRSGDVYLQPGKTTPYVYFDARTYVVVDPMGVPKYAAYAVPGAGVARPYKSSQPNATFNAATDPRSDMALHYENRTSYQILAAGLDDHYGVDHIFPDANGNQVPMFRTFREGLPYHPDVHPNPNDPLQPAYADYFVNHGDNLANFSEGRSLEDSKP